MCNNACSTAIEWFYGFELEKQSIDRISFRKLLGFPEYILDSTRVWQFGKRIIDNCKEEMNMVIVESQLDCLVLKIKSRVIKELLLSI